MSSPVSPIMPFQHSINCRGRLLDLAQPQVMGILNITPDSFFDGARYQDPSAILQQAEKMLREGATILDIGGASSRSGAATVETAEELNRVIPVLMLLQKNFPDAILSIDTWRAAVAKAAVEAGAHIINDISAGNLDPAMLETVGTLQVPYILMHMQGNPDTMQKHPSYTDVVPEVLDFFIQKLSVLKGLGVKDIVLDPGFGFGKTLEHNFELLKNLDVFQVVTGLPVLAGISRKSMICKALGIPAAEALNGTSALHMVALQQGAKILRVHDVKEAVEVIQLWKRLQ